MTIVDGDTFVAQRRDELYLVKLSGVEAPELEQAYGREARDRLASLIEGQHVTVSAERSDGCLRSARVEMSDGTDVAEKMLVEGIVWATPSAPDRWHFLESRAREEKRGLWRGADPEPPWTYRRRSIEEESHRP